MEVEQMYYGMAKVYLIGLLLAIGAIMFELFKLIKFSSKLVNCFEINIRNNLHLFSGENTLKYTLYALLFCLSLPITIFISRNHFKDIPHFVNKDFSKLTGIVTGQNSNGEYATTRGFTVKNLENNEYVNLNVVYGPIRKGEVYEVIYLPYTKCGQIIKKADMPSEVNSDSEKIMIK